MAFDLGMLAGVSIVAGFCVIVAYGIWKYLASPYRTVVMAVLTGPVIRFKNATVIGDKVVRENMLQTVLKNGRIPGGMPMSQFQQSLMEKKTLGIFSKLVTAYICEEHQGSYTPVRYTPAQEGANGTINPMVIKALNDLSSALFIEDMKAIKQARAMDNEFKGLLMIAIPCLILIAGSIVSYWLVSGSIAQTMADGYDRIIVYTQVQTDQMLIAQGREPIYNVEIPVEAPPETEQEKPKPNGMFGGLI